jgi:hypothetical protein
VPAPKPDLLEQGREPSDARVARAGRVAERAAHGPSLLPLATAAALVLCVGVGGVVTRDEPVRRAPVAAAVETPRSIPAERRALALPPGRSRRTSAAQLAVSQPDAPADVDLTAPVAGHEKARVGARPSELTAREATYAVAGDYCADVSLVRLRLLRNVDSWSEVTYYVRVYEERPRDGSFAIQLTWTGKGYDYFVTGPAGECRGRG